MVSFTLRAKPSPHREAGLSEVQHAGRASGMYVCKPSDFPSASDVPRIQIAWFGAGRSGRKKPKEAPGGRADEHNRGQPCFRSARIPLCLHARASPATGSEPSACKAATASVQPAVRDGAVRPAVSRSPEVSGSEVAGHCPVEPGTGTGPSPSLSACGGWRGRWEREAWPHPADVRLVRLC